MALPTDEELEKLAKAADKTKPEKAADGEVPLEDQNKDDAASDPVGVEFIGQRTRDSFEVLPNQRLAEFDTRTASAYGVKTHGGPKLVYVLGSVHGARLNVARALLQSPSKALVKPHDWGRITWSDGIERFAIVAEKPDAKKLAQALSTPFTAFTEEEIKQYLVLPAVDLLSGLEASGKTYRGFRHTNLYLANDGSKKLYFGDAITGPAAYDQDVVFEPVYSAMAHPSARGEGSIADDLYALGITAIFLHEGRNPFSSDDNTVLSRKLDRGSIEAMTENLNLSRSMTRFLNGVLRDNPANRWDLDQVRTWANGTAIDEHRPTVRKSGTRPAKFMDREYETLPAMAQAFNKNWRQAAGVLGDISPLDNWIKDHIERSNLEIRWKSLVDSFRNVGGGASKFGDDYQIAKICMKLDPSAPLRFKASGYMVNGFGPAFAEGLVYPEVKAHLLEVFDKRLHREYLKRYQAEAGDALPEEIVKQQRQEEKDVTVVSNFLRVNALGYGYERCLYELNPYIQCYSPIFEGKYIYRLDQVLPALEKIAGSRKKPENLSDAHLIAFLLARCSTFPSHWVAELKSAQSKAAVWLGIIRMLSHIQDKTKEDRLPKLTKWLAEKLKPVVKVYKNRKRRARIEKKLQSACNSGILRDLVDLIDDEGERRTDLAGFTEARRHYNLHEMNIRMLSRKRDEILHSENAFGRKVAALVCFVVALVISYITVISGLMS